MNPKRNKKSTSSKPQGLTWHHRRPVSLGGDKHDKRNISRVPCYKHEAWHILFDNYPVADIETLFPIFCNSFGRRGRLEVKRGSWKWVWSGKSWFKKRQAWSALFRGLTLGEILRQINTVWIDPDFELFVPYGTQRIALRDAKGE